MLRLLDCNACYIFSNTDLSGLSPLVFDQHASRVSALSSSVYPKQVD